MADALFLSVEKWQGIKPWGKFLDAGTGVHSLRWIHNLQTESWTAITADNGMKDQVVRDHNIIPREQDRIIVGNWMDEQFCDEIGYNYDTILADYLIGAVDGFSPYCQDIILEK